MNLIVQEIDVHLEIIGEGEQILLLHGWQDSSKGYEGLVEQLKEQYQLIVPDLPGFGTSQAPQSAWGVNEYATFIAALVDKLELSQLKAVAGHSMGGRFAMKLFADKLVEADRLILLSSAGVPENQSGKAVAFKAVAKTGKVLVSPLPGKIKDSLKAKLYKAAGSDDYLNAGVMRGVFSKVIKEDARKYAQKIQAKTLLIYGKEDTVTPPAYGEVFAELIPDSKLVILEGLRHNAHKKDPVGVSKLIREFI